MTHLGIAFTEKVELGAIRRLMYDTEIVKTDGGNEVRNARWSEPLRTFDVSLPPSRRDDPEYLSVLDVYEQSLGGLHTFNFTDWTDESGATVVKVRFDSPLEITGIATHLDHIETFTLQEVRS